MELSTITPGGMLKYSVKVNISLIAADPPLECVEYFHGPFKQVRKFCGPYCAVMLPPMNLQIFCSSP